MFRDSTRRQLWPQLVARPFRCFGHLLAPALIRQAARQAGVAEGQGPLNVVTLVWLALACAWHRTRSYADVLGLTLKLLQDLADGPSPRTAVRAAPRRRRRRHDPRVRDAHALSEEAFVQARQRLPWAFWLALIGLLADRCERRGGADNLWRGRYRLLSLDGTCLDVPNWARVAAHFGTAGKGKGRRQAQARLVLLQLTKTRLPWRFDLTPVGEAETTVAGRLLRELRCDDLVLMDRGFWSYGLFWQAQQRGAFFAVRLRKQVKYQVLRQLGPGDALVRWRPAARWRQQGLPEAIDLRVLPYQVPGFRPSAVVTNLLDAAAAPAAAFVQLAAAEEGRRVWEVGVYHQRWGIETTFYELKVTQGLGQHWRSRTPQGVRYEVAGHLLLYQLLRWLLVEAAQDAGNVEPLQLSYQGALEELQDLWPTLFRAGRRRLRRVLLPRLRRRLGQHVIPWRPGRHYRRPHDTQAKAKGRGRYQEASKLPEVVTGAASTPAGDTSSAAAEAPPKPRRRKVA
jgi:hypothetical protein